ncbi:acyl-CoA N-acyltransferase [Coprinopsis sp. MPI-PUGE-AT-0042]|nr:acyl-CoA N-acyltransferase [Coprinopsis sp. MPI-PUGE-AT-0042]
MAELALYSPDKKIRFTLPSPEDDEPIAKLRSDPLCRKYIRFLPDTIPVAEVTKQREARAKNPHNLDFVFSILDEEHKTYQFAGVCNVFLFDATHMWGDAGLWIVSERHGQGLLTPVMYMLLQHVFEQRGLHRISFMTGEDNAPMRGWLTRVAGIREEGTFKGCWKDPSGVWTDVVTYGVLADEWTDRVKASLEKKMKERGLGMAKEGLN